MSHPDPLYDPENSEENDMGYDDFDAQAERNMSPWIDDQGEEWIVEDPNYDDYNDFYGDVTAEDLEDNWDDSYDDSMDGDAESALSSAGWGTDEDYGYYGDDDREDFHADEAVGFVDYNEDGPYYD